MNEATSSAAFHNSDEALIVNFGGGVDSTAILVGLVRRFRAGDATARPALVIFADTGSELPATYDNVERVSAWLTIEGFPPVTVINRNNSGIKTRVKYTTIEGNMLANETLPGEAFGRGNCSCKWKHEPMDAFLFGGKRPARAGWLLDHGFTGKPIKLVGYDATEVASGKRAKNAAKTEDASGRYGFRYPLVEWNWSREDCEREIAAEGLVVPVKSACFFCPNQRPCELRAMAASDPALFLRALVIEEVARRGKNGLGIEGLWRRTRKADGRSGSWVTWAKAEGILAAAEQAAGVTLEELVQAAKPGLKTEPTEFTAAAPKAARTQPKPARARETVAALVSRLVTENPGARFSEVVALAVESGANNNTARGALVRPKSAA